MKSKNTQRAILFVLNMLKKSAVLILVMLIISINDSHAQNKPSEYYSHTPDGTAKYTISTDKVLIAFREGITLEKQTALIKGAAIFKPLKAEMNLPSPRVTIAEILPGKTEKEILRALAQLRISDDVIYANSFLVYSDGTLQGIQDRFAVKLKSASDYSKLESLVRNNGAEIVEPNRYDPLVYFIKVNKNSKGNALELANQFAESKQFTYAEPDFLKILIRFNTNDTFLNYQWSLNNTGSAIQYSGTAGADMNVFSAWGISTGNAATKVAIIDEGVDLVHPDLVGNILSGFDGTQQGSGGAPQGNDAHGTSCAGIVAASGNNNLGIAGVAYNAKIVPVRIAYSSGSNWITSDAWIGTSIDWAWNQGDADVLSNSWGGGSSSSLINDPIGRAVTLGRGGLGSVVLFAAGNNNGAVSYPGNLPNVISVAAMSMCNQRKSPTSCDGENFWGSNFGTNVDIAAPGVKIYTTDISGANGYSSGDYTPTFNGTSSATPNAAGVMALILATNPALTQAEARQIIESTCVKTGGYTYNSSVAGQPNGTWSNDLGYGRVNAFAALQLANPVPCTNPPAVATTNASPNSFCTSPTTISLNLSGITFGSGQSYQWQSSPDNITWTNISGATNQIYAATISVNTWFRCLVTCTATTASAPVQVTYSDPTVTTYPHTQNFDGGAGLPCGWTVQNVNGDANTWINANTSPRSAPNAMTYTYNPSAAANDWLFTAPLNMTAGIGYQVSFWYRAQSATYPESMEVKWGNSPSAAGMTSPAIFSNSSIANTAYAQGNGLFTPTTSGIYYVGFRVSSNADMWLLMIDDVTIDIAGVCLVPNVGGTASGPSVLTAGTTGTYNLTGFTGTNINWQMSTNGGTTYTDILGATTASSAISLPIGSYLIRAKVTSTGSCLDAFSNAISVTVNPRPGDNLGIALPASLPYSTTLSTTAGNGFTSQYTGTNSQSSPDVFFVLTTGPCVDSLSISTCTGSDFDTYLHLLNSSGTNITSNDDNGTYCAGTRASLKVAVAPNTTYYVVVEGYSSSTGTFQLNITAIDNPVYTASITAGGPTSFCSGGSVTLTCSSANSYLWSNGATTQSINVTSSGQYSAIAFNTNGCAASSNMITVTVQAGLTYYADFDVDGYGNPNATITSCTPFLGFVLVAGDCNDNNSSINPAATEVCNGIDDDCDNLIDEGFDTDGDGYTSCAGDCNNNNAAVNPGAIEVCNGIDDDCDNLIDEGFDADSDGYTTCAGDCNDNNAAVRPGATEICNGIDDDCDNLIDEGFDVDGDGYTTCAGDCNDNNPAVRPGATEICNGIDDDCDNLIDEGFDLDGDGYTTCAGDCNDNNAAVRPGATEICNGIDDDCDNLIDEGFDTDGDGYTSCAGDCNNNNAAVNPGATEICNGIDDDCDNLIDEGFDLDGDGYTTCAGDCNDNNAAVRPGATEICNGIDDDCDNLIDEGFDVDGDGYTSCAGDCNDNNAAVRPGATEICNGIDDDCDNLIDEGFDVDGDGYTSCAGDCNDNNAAVRPGATEICNGIDDDCDNLIDEGFDLDGDGYTTCAGDCNDNNAAIHPGATEICSNGIDDDCDNLIDEGCCNISITGIVTNATCPAVADGAIDITVVGGIPVYIYTWNGGAATTVPDLNNLAPGIYTVVVTDLNMCTATATFQVFDNGGTAPAQPSAINGPVGVCRSQTGVVFTATPVAGATSYIWTLPTGATGTSSTNSITLNFSATYNTGNLCVRAVNICGQSSNLCTSVVYLTAIPAVPGAISGGSTGACVGNTVTYSIASVPFATSYEWSTPLNSTILSGQGTTSITVSYNAGTAASGTVRVRAGNCRGNSNYSNLTVYGTPTAPGTISGIATGVCAGSTQTYSISAVNGATAYNWTVPAGCIINSGQGTISVSVTFGGAFVSGTIAVTASSVCATSAQKTLAVSAALSVLPNISGQSGNLCGGGTFTYTITAVAGATSYNWTVPSGCGIVTNLGTSITITIPSNFVSGNLCYTVTNSCGVSAPKCLTLSRNPSTPSSITGSASVCPNATNIQYSTPQIGSLTYTWTVPANVTIVSGQGTNTIVLNWGPTAGSVFVKANNTCGSSANQLKSVSMLSCLSTLNPGNADAMDYHPRMVVYPNPTNGTFTIKAPFSGQVYIKNELGQIIRSIKLNEDNFASYDVSGLSAGLYFISGEFNGEYYTEKIIVTP
jgi:subtilisin family serine protease